MKKVAFDKIRSNIEKRKILAQAVQDKAEITLKVGDDHLAAFLPALNENSALTGHLPEGVLPDGEHEALASFVLDPHRYFYNGKASVKNGHVVVDVEGDLFQFQRRSSLRVEIPFFLKLTINITEINGRPIFIQAQAHDISAGGLRYFYTDYSGPPAKAGDRVHGVLHSGPNKSIEFEGLIRHLMQFKTEQGTHQTHYGLEFSKGPMQRMLSLSLEIQRRAIAGSS